MWWERKLCNAFSCLVTKEGKVLWEAGKDSHEKLIDKYGVNDIESESHKLGFARIEIVPDNKEKYRYLWPELDWKFVVDEQNKPRWLTNTYEQRCWVEFQKWKTQVYQFNYVEARNPINPLLIEPPQINNEHIQLLKQWDSVVASVWDSVWDSVRDSVWDSVRDSVWDSVRDSVGASVVASVWDSVWDSIGDSVRDSVWDSVGASVRASVRASVWDSIGAYVGSLFPNIPELHKNGKYIYQPIIDLWMQGIIPSFDDTTYRLHTKNGVVYEATKKQLSKTK